MNKNELAKLKAKYGDIKEVQYEHIGKRATIVVRKPTFREYIYISKNSINYAQNPKENPIYDIDPDAAATTFNNVVVFPKGTTVNDVPPGVVLEACIASVSLCKFENQKELKDLYIQSIKNSQTIVGAITQRLITSFGIQVWPLLESLDENEVMDLIVLSEIVQNDLGMLAKITQLEGIPLNHRGKLELHKVLGINPKNNARRSPMQQQSDKKIRTYYKSLGKSDEEIDKILNRFDEMDTEQQQVDVADIEKDPNAKLDIAGMSEAELSNIPYDKYMQLKKDGKLMQFEESVKKGIEKSKNALAEKIKSDKELYGNAKPEKHFTGNMKDLLKVVKDKTRDIE